MIKKEVKKERGMDANKVWDENGNTWTPSKWEAVNPEYTQEWYEKITATGLLDEQEWAEVEKALNAIIEHYNLVNCVNCVDCGWCVDCENLMHSTNCNSCYDSYHLTYCINSAFCNYCGYCSYCRFSNDLYHCVSCEFCNRLHKENDNTLKRNAYEQQEIKNND